jgi:hypothetical protein
MWRISSRLLMSAVVLSCFIGRAEPAQAQLEPMLDDRQAALPHDPVPLTDAQFEQYEQWFFGPRGVDGAREQLETTLQWKIRKVDDTFKLTLDQKKKLELAGQCDIKRFFDGLRMQKEDPVRSRLILGLVRQLEIEDELGARQPPFRVPAMVIQKPAQANVRNLPGDLFGNGSMFAKTVATTVTSDQRTRAREIEGLSTYENRVHWVVFYLDKQLGLNQDQHRRFVNLIVKHTHPLEKYGRFDDEAVLLQASRLPEDQIKPIFKDAQWHQLKVHFDRARRMEKMLIENGCIHPDDSHATPPKATEEGARGNTTNGGTGSI